MISPLLFRTREHPPIEAVALYHRFQNVGSGTPSSASDSEDDDDGDEDATTVTRILIKHLPKQVSFEVGFCYASALGFTWVGSSASSPPSNSPGTSCVKKEDRGEEGPG